MTINEMLNSDAYQRWESSRLGNDLFINDPKRAARLHEYAEEGLNGSSHAEVIQDWLDYVADSDFPEDVKASLLKEVDRVEKWHIKNGSIDEIGC
jgi:hypothetical protein